MLEGRETGSVREAARSDDCEVVPGLRDRVPGGSIHGQNPIGHLASNSEAYSRVRIEGRGNLMPLRYFPLSELRGERENYLTEQAFS
jgi:hypothetical protein